MMAADTLGASYTYHFSPIFHPCIPSMRTPLNNPIKTIASYGSLARFKSIQRLHTVGDYTVIGAGGDMSDFQYIQGVLDDIMVGEYAAADGHKLGPAEIHEYLSQVMYARRSKMDPLWNSLVVGGVKDGKK